MLSRTSGLVQAIAISRVQAEKLTLAPAARCFDAGPLWAQSCLLRQLETWGVMCSVAPLQSSADRTDAPVRPHRRPVMGRTPTFQRLTIAQRSFANWMVRALRCMAGGGLLETRAEIDDSPRVFGLQVELSASATGF